MTKGPLVSNGPILAPLVQPNSTRRFRDGIERVAAATLAKKWDVAAKRVTTDLPKLRFTASWDERGVPTPLRAAFRTAGREAAMAFRSGAAYEVTWVPPGKPADIAFSFVKKLDDGLAIVERPNYALDGVIGLARGSRGAKTGAFDVYNDVAFAIGTYLGLGSAALPGNVMYRLSEPSAVRMGGTPIQYIAIRRNVAAVASLAQAVGKRRTVLAPRPSALLEGDLLDVGRKLEGEVAPVTIQLANRGEGPLVYRTDADCGCIVERGEGTVPPGGVVLLRPAFDTTGYRGPVEKRIVVYTNDAETPIHRATIRVDVAPRQTWTGPEALVLPLKGGGKFRYELAIEPGANYTPVSGTLDGARGTVKIIEQATGLYHIDIDVPGDDVPAGRGFGGLTLKTDSEAVPVVRRAFAIQRGIAPNPSEIYLGMLTPVDRVMRVKLLRPGAPFRILSATGSVPRVTATAPKTSADAHEIVVKIGGGSRGDLEAKLLVRTDDPDQPLIEIPVRGLGG